MSAAILIGVHSRQLGTMKTARKNVLAFPAEAGRAICRPPAQIGARANCDRCKREIEVAPPKNETSYPFRLAVVPKGVCADCVMTQFLYNTYPINMQLDESGPQLLLNPYNRDALLMSGILETGDLTVDEINWQRVVDNWALPVKTQTSAKNPYRMGDAAKSQQSLRELEDATVRGDKVIVSMLRHAGVSEDKARKAVEADSGTRVITHGGTYTLHDLRQRHAQRLAPGNGITTIVEPGRSVEAIQSADGKVFLTTDGTCVLPDVEDRFPTRRIIENCRFCQGRGCLSCETEERTKRRTLEADTLKFPQRKT